MEEIKVHKTMLISYVFRMATYFADITINFISQLLEPGFGYTTCLGHLGINKQTVDNGKVLTLCCFFSFFFFFFLSVVDLKRYVSFKCTGR